MIGDLVQGSFGGCPRCGTPFRVATQATDRTHPFRPGVYGVCLACGQLVIVGEGGVPRLPTARETMTVFLSDEADGISQMQRVIHRRNEMAIRAAKSEGGPS